MVTSPTVLRFDRNPLTNLGPETYSFAVIVLARLRNVPLPKLHTRVRFPSPAPATFPHWQAHQLATIGILEHLVSQARTAIDYTTRGNCRARRSVYHEHGSRCLVSGPNRAQLVGLTSPEARATIRQIRIPFFASTLPIVVSLASIGGRDGTPETCCGASSVRQFSLSCAIERLLAWFRSQRSSRIASAVSSRSRCCRRRSEIVWAIPKNYGELLAAGSH